MFRIIADLRSGTYYQKCHDPDCRRINFRSNGNDNTHTWNSISFHFLNYWCPNTEIPIPLECNPVLQQVRLEEEERCSSRAEFSEAKLYIGDVSLEEIQQFEETASASSSLRSKSPSPETEDSQTELDIILKEALEDYEAHGGI